MRTVRFVLGGVGVVGVLGSMALLAITGQAFYFISLVVCAVVVHFVAPNRRG